MEPPRRETEGTVDRGSLSKAKHDLCEMEVTETAFSMTLDRHESDETVISVSDTDSDFDFLVGLLYICNRQTVVHHPVL